MDPPAGERYDPAAIGEGGVLQPVAEFITDFGDSAVTLPLALMVLLYLLWARWFRAALCWGLAVGACGVVMAVLKIGFLACAAPPLQLILRSPSGHAALAATVYGGLAGLVAAQCRREWMVLPHAVAQLAIMAIALSRVAVLAHSPEEVMVGLGLGTTLATLCTLALGPAPAGMPPLSRLFGLAAVIVTVTHGLRFQIEGTLQTIAPALRDVLCP